MLETALTHHQCEPIEIRSASAPVLADAAFYLIKLYTHGNEALFGTMAEGKLNFSKVGQVAADEWLRMSQAHRGIGVDQWMIAPDRLEAIVAIREPFGATSYGSSLPSKPRILSSFVAGYKAAAAKRINLLRNCPGSPVWQRSYHERLIPDEAMLERIRQILAPKAA